VAQYGRRGGTAATEAALVLPVLTVILIGGVDFGRAIHAQIVLTNAVRVGAEYGATHRFTAETQADWEARIRETMLDEAASISGFAPESFVATVTVTPATSTELRVQVAATYPFRSAVSWPGMPDALLLRHEVTMRQYQ
jgi:Flp pilus assembly protein TadG